MNIDMSKIDYEKLKLLALDYGLKIVAALAVLVGGLFIIGVIKNSLDGIMKKKNKDETLRTFGLSLIDIGLKIMLFLTVISMLGVQIASFVAIIGAAGLAVGLALQGSLSNLAAGVQILVFRPFVVGDYIEAKGYAGKVIEIQIFHTVIKTDDGLRVIIPNGGVSGSNIVIHLDK